MLEKTGFTLISKSIEALNCPDWYEFNMSRIKVASTTTASIDKNTDNFGGFDVKAAIKEHPDHLFVKVFAIKKDEVNDNGDAFSESELKKAAHTFIGVPIFTNHQNDDIEKAKGKCVHAWYDDDKGGIYIISMIDKVAYPQLARGLEEKYIFGTSMGCSVDHSICSICHNSASVALDYCSHIKEQKNKKFSGKIKCQYHNSPNKPKDDCPICGCKLGEEKEHIYKEAQTFEWNLGIKFIEDSLVVNPACHDCLVCDILNPGGMKRKIAELRDKINGLQKAASVTSTAGLYKYAGQQELDILTDVMDKIEVVAKSMMAQKQHVSMEYVSDLIDALASMQATTDELAEMGFGQLPSPDLTAVSSLELPKKTGVENLPLPQATQPTQPVQTQPMQPALQVPPAGQPAVGQPAPGIQTEQIGGLGSVTKPKFSEVIEKKKEEFFKASSSLLERLDSLKNKFVSIEKIQTIEQIGNIQKESMTMDKTGNIENNNAVTAGAEVILEKKLDNATLAGERREAPSVITEKQLGNPPDVNLTTSDSPQKRTGSYDTITEKQLDSVKKGYVLRWDDFPTVITEKQWTDMSRLIGSELSQPQDNRITEKQLADFLSKHRYTELNKITEKQLSDQDGKLSRVAYVYDADALVKSAVSAVADAIAFYGKTPAEIKMATSYMTENAKNLDKAAFLVLVNALPHKAETKQAEKGRFGYLSKLANKTIETQNPVDVLVSTMSDYVGEMSADDLVTAAYHVASSVEGIEKAEELAKTKMAQGPEYKTTDKVQSLKKALASLNRSDDGIYEVSTVISEIGDPSNKEQFVNSAYKFANNHVASKVGENLDTALLSVDIDETKGVVSATIKETSKLTDMEKKAWGENPLAEWSHGLNLRNIKKLHREQDAIEPTDEELWAIENEENELAGEYKEPGKDEIEIEIEPAQTKPCMASRKANRQQLVKEAQLLGGQLGGQAGASQAPGAGASLPQPPPEAGSPIESFEKSDLGGEFEGEGDLDVTPPGTKCPMCTSSDVDWSKGEGHCNNCGTNYEVETILKITGGPGMPGESKKEETEAAAKPLAPTAPAAPASPAIPAPAPVGGTPAMPAAASVKNDKVVKTASFTARDGTTVELVGYSLQAVIKPTATAKLKEGNIKLGSVSPLTGSTNTIDLGKGKHLCLDTGMSYTLEYAVKPVKEAANKVYARWSWTPLELVTASIEGCSHCQEARKALVDALATKNITEEAFDNMSMEDKGRVLVEIKSSSAKSVKTASVHKEASIVQAIKTAANVDLGNDMFPMETCLERLARRYGDEALALSGPCEGKPLADCVCKSLKKAGVYSDNMSVKLAEVWKDKEGSMECLEDYVRLGFELKEAASICESMKTKYASFDDVLAQQIGEIVGDELEVAPEVEEPMVSDFGDEDPFADDVEGTVVVELPKSVVEQIDAALDKTLGEHVEPDGSMEAPVETDITETVTPEETAITETVEPVTEAPEAVEEGGEVKVEIEAPEEAAEEIEEMVHCKICGGEMTNSEWESNEGKCSVCRGGNEEVEEKEDVVKDITESQKSKLPAGLAKAIEAKEKGETTEKPVEEKSEEKPAEEKVENEEGKNKETAEEDKAEKNDLPGVLNPEENDKPVEKEGDDTEKEENKDTTMETTEKEASAMRHGYVGKTDEVTHLDFTKLMNIIGKQAAKVKSSPAQDNVPFQYSGKSQIGDEQPPKAEKASAPSKGNASQIGNEDFPKGETADIPTSDARVSGEKENNNLKPELDDTATGGEQGSGTSKAANTTKERISRLAEAILEAQTKVVRKFDQDDPDIGQVSSKDGFIGDEKASIGEVPDKKTPKEIAPTNANAFIGDEKASIGEQSSPMPSIPTSDARVKGEKDNAKIAPEKDNQVTGLMSGKAASTSNESNRRKEATRIAGLMLKAGKIEVDHLANKIAELERYEISTMKDIESSLFEKKGLNKPANGVESAPIMASSQPKYIDSKSELVAKMQDLFTATKKIKMAEQDETIQTRKMYGRI